MSDISTQHLNTDIEHFDELGYVVFPALIDRFAATSLWREFDNIQAVPYSDGILLRNERRLLVDRRFFEVATNDRVVSTATRLLGEDIQILDHLGIEKPAHSGEQRSWHTDFAYVGSPLLIVTTTVYLQDLTDETGPLYCVPGTHLKSHLGPDQHLSERLDGEVKMNLPAGSAVMFHSNLLHSSSRNNSNRPRRMLFNFYGRYWMKRLDEFYETALPQYILENDDPLIRQLFGIRQTSLSVPGSSYNATIYR